MGHDHHHGLHSRGQANRWRLAAVLGFTASFLCVELIAGWATGSLALLSDAGHMAADVVALGAALVATIIAGRPPSSPHHTFGFYRVEVFAAAGAVVIMLASAAYIVFEAIGRLGHDGRPNFTAMMLVGVLGLLVNLASLAILRQAASDSLNIKGAYLEVLADAVGSVGVLVAGVLVATTGRGFWDTVVALAIAVFVAVRAVVLGREVAAVLSQSAPRNIDVVSMKRALTDLPGVVEVHDVHVWTLTSGMPVATTHLMVDDLVDLHGVLDQARDVVRDEFSVQHATIQVEPRSHLGCDRLQW